MTGSSFCGCRKREESTVKSAEGLQNVQPATQLEGSPEKDLNMHGLQFRSVF
jgi:hypothetical protein